MFCCNLAWHHHCRINAKGKPFPNNAAFISSACFAGLHLWRLELQPKSLYGREKYQEFAVSKSGRSSSVNKTQLQTDQQRTLHSFSRGTWKMAPLKYCISHSPNNWASWQAFFSELERKLDSAQLCGRMRCWGPCQGQNGLAQESRGGPGPSTAQGMRRQGEGGPREEKVGKVERQLTESQGHCSDSVIPSWKESVFLCLTLWPQVSRMLLAP